MYTFNIPTICLYAERDCVTNSMRILYPQSIYYVYVYLERNASIHTYNNINKHDNTPIELPTKSVRFDHREVYTPIVYSDNIQLFSMYTFIYIDNAFICIP